MIELVHNVSQFISRFKHKKNTEFIGFLGVYDALYAPQPGWPRSSHPMPSGSFQHNHMHLDRVWYHFPQLSYASSRIYIYIIYICKTQPRAWILRVFQIMFLRTPHTFKTDPRSHLIERNIISTFQRKHMVSRFRALESVQGTNI